MYVHFDGVKIPVNIEYVDDPTFEKFQGVYKYDKESSIKIKVRRLKLKYFLVDKIHSIIFYVFLSVQSYLKLSYFAIK